MLIDDLPHECTVRRRVRAKGTLGGSKDSFTNEQTAVACWEQHASNSEIDLYQQMGMVATHKVYFSSDPGIGSKHQILITKRQGTTVSSPIALDVISEADPDISAGLGILYKVMCRQVKASDT